MLSVPVHKDISEYREKVVGKLSARTLACTAGGLCASVAAAAGVHFGFGVEVADAALPVMACSMPFWLLGFWRPCGLAPERFAALYAAHVLGDGRLAYCAGGGWPAGLAPSRVRVDRRARRAARRRGAELRRSFEEGDGCAAPGGAAGAGGAAAMRRVVPGTWWRMGRRGLR